ncbi:unnamed protein product [Rhizophagus irregularis]|nr:unnamed protein product [Rhizophagus irregularis]
MSDNSFRSRLIRNIKIRLVDPIEMVNRSFGPGRSCPISGGEIGKRPKKQQILILFCCATKNWEHSLITFPEIF